jgi:cardiolipin synthase
VSVKPFDNPLTLTRESGVNVRPGASDDGWSPPPPVVLSDATLAQLLKDGEALRAAFDAIGLAERVICLQVYIFAGDDTARRFVDLLCAKAHAGVRVYVIYDSFGSFGTPRSQFDQLRRAGVRVSEFHPMRPWDCRFSWRPFNRDHRKLVVVDDQIAWLGGLNIADEYGGPWIAGEAALRHIAPWRDTAVGLRGPCAETLFTAFKKTWNYLQHGGRIKRCEHIHDGVDMDVLGTVACLNSPLRPRLTRAFAGARQSIDLTMAYFAPDDQLVEQLCNAARRGVVVRLMLPEVSDLPFMVVAARSFYTRMLEAGVRVFERRNAVLHAKTIVIDQRVSIVGSTNLDYRSIEYNCELSVAIRSVPFGRQMVQLFENDVRFAREIDLKQWRKRNTRDRLGQWVVNRARYLL